MYVELFRNVILDKAVYPNL